MPYWNPHEYQAETVNNALLNLKPTAGQALFMDPGLGKTSVSLQIVSMLKMFGLAKRTLVVAPLRVCYSVWRQEAMKWDQFRPLTFSLVHGDKAQRIKALAEPANVYLVPFSQIEWVTKDCEQLLRSFDILIVDESSQIKDGGTKRFKATRKAAACIPYRMILSGTPTPHSMMDLWSQIFILDFGERLGKTQGEFRARYCDRGGFKGHGWKLRQGSVDLIKEKIADIAVSLRAVDHLPMPDMIVNDVFVDLPHDARVVYDELEREFIASLKKFQTDADLISQGAGVYIKCRQIANGGVYVEESKPVELHTEKVEAIKDIVEELNGKPALIAYHFTHDLARLLKVFGSKHPVIKGGISGKEADAIINRWNAGELPLLFVQPQSLSHGVNMQSGPGRDIIWTTPPDRGEDYTQLNARIYRQGVSGSVRIHRIIARDTFDEMSLKRLNTKIEDQDSLLNSLRRYAAGRRP